MSKKCGTDRIGRLTDKPTRVFSNRNRQWATSSWTFWSKNASWDTWRRVKLGRKQNRTEALKVGMSGELEHERKFRNLPRGEKKMFWLNSEWDVLVKCKYNLPSGWQDWIIAVELLAGVELEEVFWQRHKRGLLCCGLINAANSKPCKLLHPDLARHGGARNCLDNRLT